MHATQMWKDQLTHGVRGSNQISWGGETKAASPTAVQHCSLSCNNENRKSGTDTFSGSGRGFSAVVTPTSSQLPCCVTLCPEFNPLPLCSDRRLLPPPLLGCRNTSSVWSHHKWVCLLPPPQLSPSHSCAAPACNTSPVCAFCKGGGLFFFLSSLLKIQLN